MGDRRKDNKEPARRPSDEPEPAADADEQDTEGHGFMFLSDPAMGIHSARRRGSETDRVVRDHPGRRKEVKPNRNPRG